MQLSLVGINHQTAPIAIREKAAINYEKLSDALLLLRSYIPKGIILSTCNRTELYAIDSNECNAEKVCMEFLKSRIDVSNKDLPRHIYVYKDREAIEHLFRVAGGLESMIVGEFEILGQVNQALDIAEKVEMVNLPLRQFFQSAIQTGRRIRTETEISKNALSISSVAVDYAADIIGDLAKCKVLVIGTGEAGRLVAKIARERGTSRIIIAGRTEERASAIATPFNGIPVSLDNLADELINTNMVVTCAGAPHRILDVQQVEKVMKRRPQLPLVIIDIALPRNVAPEVGQIQNVFLHNIDDLTKVTHLNRRRREAEIIQAEEIIKIETDKFLSRWQLLDTRSMVSALMSKAEEIRLAQLHKTLKKLRPLSDEEHERLDSMTRSIVSKILKDPIHYIKANKNNNQAEVVKELFQLYMEEHP